MQGLAAAGERLEAHVATTSDLRVNVAVMVIKNGFLRLMDLPGEFTNRARCYSVVVVVTADVIAMLVHPKLGIPLAVHLELEDLVLV